MVSAFFGVSSVLIFVSFGGFFVLEGQVEWPLMAGSLFFSWLSYKYKESGGSRLFFDVRSRKEILLPRETVLLPVRQQHLLLFLLDKGGVFLYDTASGRAILSDNHPEFLALPPFWCGDKIVVCSTAGLLVFNEKLEQITIFPAADTGISLALSYEQKLLYGTCQAEFFSVDLSSLESVQTFHVEGIPSEFFPEEKILFTSYGVAYRWQNNELEKILPWRSEVLGFAPFRSGAMLYNDRGEVFYDDLQKRVKLGSYHRDYPPPFVHNNFLYYTDLARDLMQINAQGEARVIITFRGVPFIWRVYPNFLCVAAEKGRRVTFRVCALSTGECYSYECGLSEILCIAENVIVFSPYKTEDWLIWRFGEPEPEVQTCIPPLQALFFSNGASCSFLDGRWVFSDGKELPIEKSLCHAGCYDCQAIDLMPLKYSAGDDKN